MAVLDWIRPDQAIRISRGEQHDNLFYSAIQYVREDSFDIAIPYLRTIPLILTDLETIHVYVPSIGGMIMFQCQVLGSRFETIPLYVLSMPAEFVRIQQRNFVRLPCTLEVAYAEKPVTEGRTLAYHKTSSVDISGCGVSFIATRNYPNGTSLVVRIWLPEEDSEEIRMLQVEGRVVRTWNAERAGMIYMAVEFTEVTAAQQDLIVHYIFRKMAEAAHKHGPGAPG